MIDYLEKYFKGVIKMEGKISEEDREYASKFAKGLVCSCVRNNTVLEDVHTGEEDLTKEETMKRLMIECTNNVYVIILSLFYGIDHKAFKQFTVSDLMHAFVPNQYECRKWNDAEIPAWVKRVAESTEPDNQQNQVVGNNEYE